MASTYVDGTFSVPNYAHRLRLTVTETSQNVAANTTTVSWVLQITKMTNYGGNSSNANPWAVSIGGAGYSGTFTYNLSGQPVGYTITIASGTTTIAHNADGTKSISISSSANTTVLGNASNSGTFTLTTIPRASNPTFSPNPVEAGATLSIATNRASSSFTHDITYSIGSASGTVATGVGASTTWTVPMSVLDQIPNATSGALTLTTVTKNGATVIGTKTTTVTVSAPASVVPTIGNVVFAEATTTPDVATIVGAFVKLISKLSTSLTGVTGAYGSTITSSSVELIAPDGVTVLWSTTAAGAAAAGTTPALPQSGNLLLRGTVTDSRNRVGTKTVTVPVMNYALPTIASFTAARSTSGGTLDPSGTSIRVDVTSSVQSLIVGTQKNNLKYRLRIRQRGSTTPWASVTPAASSAGVGGVAFADDIIVGGYAANFGWEVRFELEDNLGQVSVYEVQVGTAGVQFFLSGTSDMVGMGKYPETYDPSFPTGLDVRDNVFAGGQRVLTLGDFATNSEVQAGTVANKPITPAGLASRTATTSRTGLVELATDAEAKTGTDTSRAVTPKGVSVATGRVIPTATVVGSGTATVASDGRINLNAVSSLRLDGVFDGVDGDAYEIRLDIITDVATPLRFAFSTGGTVVMGGSYHQTRLTVRNNGASGASTLSQDSVLLTYDTIYTYHDAVLDVYSPKLARPTTFSWQCGQHCPPSANAMNHQVVDGAGWHPGSNLFDGFYLVAETAGAKMSGWIKVVKKA